MGVKLDGDTVYSGNTYKTAVYETIKILVDRFVKVYLYSDTIFNLSPGGITQARYLSIIHTFIRNVINKRKLYLHDNIVESDTISDNDHYVYKQKKRVAMLDLLLSAEKEGLINDDGILEEVNTFMFEVKLLLHYRMLF